MGWRRILKLTSKSVMLIQFIFVLMILRTGAFVVTSQSLSDSISLAQQSSGPSFDLTRMPGFADLIPGAEPVTLTLELRVGVTDPDGVSTVIGSYKNNSSNTWTNVSMNQDATASNQDVYVARPFNYTMSEPSFVVVWDIKFYANDTLDNWNMSKMIQFSVCRQGPANYTNVLAEFLVPVAVTIIVVVLILPIIYLLIQRRG
jgi:hypothetical protein